MKKILFLVCLLLCLLLAGLRTAGKEYRRQR